MPALVGIDRVPSSDEMKHFGAALASFGSVALFHMAGVTPEAKRLEDVVPAGRVAEDRTISARPTSARYGRATRQDIGAVDRGGVLGAAAEPDRNANAGRVLDGRRATIPLLAVTSPQVKPDADRMGLTGRIEPPAAPCLSGMCFYQSYAREMAEANGWSRLATNSAKLTNILGGYGYRPVLLSMEHCVAAACAGGKSDMSGKIFYASAGMGRKVQAQALVASDGFSARYDLDRLRGVFSRPEHKLAGQSYRGRVLVLDAAKGGVATAWMLYEMAVARRHAGGTGFQPRQSDHGAGRGTGRLHNDFRVRCRYHEGDPERRRSGDQPDGGAAVHHGALSRSVSAGQSVLVEFIL